MIDPRFAALVDSGTRRVRQDNGKAGVPVPEEIVIGRAMRGVAIADPVKTILIPRLRKRIEELDEEESAVLGTPLQFEKRGRRLEAKEQLAEWLKWSGQATDAPDKENEPNAG